MVNFASLKVFTSIEINQIIDLSGCRGSVIFYRKLVHPILLNNEADIDEVVQVWREQSYQLGLKYTKAAAEKITQTVVETAIHGGSGIIHSLQHSYSLNDLRQRSSSLSEDQLSSSSASAVPKGTMSMSRRKVNTRQSNRSDSSRNISKSRLNVSAKESKVRQETKETSSEGSEKKKIYSLYGTFPR